MHRLDLVYTVFLDMAENGGHPTSIRKAAMYANLSSPTGYRFKKIKNVPDYEGDVAGVWEEQEVPYQAGENVPSPEQVEQFRRESPDYARKLEGEAKRLAELEAAPPELGFASPVEGVMNRGVALNTHPHNQDAANQINAARRRLEEARKRVDAQNVNANEAPLGGLGRAGASSGEGAGGESVFRPTLAFMAQRGENVNEFESEWARYAEKKNSKKEGGKRRKTHKARRSKRKQRRVLSRKSRK